jgi:hypothetical protein
MEIQRRKGSGGMNARVLEARRLVLGERKLEVWLEEREDGSWNVRFGRGTAEQLHLALHDGSGNGEPGGERATSLGEMLYKAELFDHMVAHLQDQMARAQGDGDGTTPEAGADVLARYAEVGVCTEGLSDEALEAMAHEFMSENYSDGTLDEIAAWARDVLSIRRHRLDMSIPAPDVLRY